MTDHYAETDEWPTPHVPAQDRTLGDEQAEGGSQDADAATGALASRDDLLLAYDRLSAEAVGRRAEMERVRALADAFADDGLARYGGNIAWHIEEAIANEKGDFPDAADRRIASQRQRAEAAEAELRALREGLQALADEWECRDDLRGSDHWRGVDFVDGKAFGYEEASDYLRALLDASPAATTGEARLHGPGCVDCDNGVTERHRSRTDKPNELRPAPVSSGEAAQHVRTSTGGHGPDFCEPCSAAAGDWVVWPCAGVSSGEAGTGEAVQS